MRLIYGNMFNPLTYQTSEGTSLDFTPDAVVITTNGFVKRDGCAVMGRGCAKRIANINPGIPFKLGLKLKQHGNHVVDLGDFPEIHGTIVTFPVKPTIDTCTSDKANVVKHMQSKFNPGDIVPGWACIANLELIGRSAAELVGLVDKTGWSHIVLPRPGCGAGELKFAEVRKVLDPILDDRFYCITFSSHKGMINAKETCA